MELLPEERVHIYFYSWSGGGEFFDGQGFIGMRILFRIRMSHRWPEIHHHPGPRVSILSVSKDKLDKIPSWTLWIETETPFKPEQD